MCFVFIWEQTATCATYSINWMVFLTEIKSVYSGVRNGSLNKTICASSLKGQWLILTLLCHARLGLACGRFPLHFSAKILCTLTNNTHFITLLLCCCCCCCFCVKPSTNISILLRFFPFMIINIPPSRRKLTLHAMRLYRLWCWATSRGSDCGRRRHGWV